jgi:predicted Zn-dependent peptidase
MSHIDKETFTNGFQYIYQKSYSKIPMTSIICLVKLGSIYEDDGNRGSSHFIEHMCFKGTKRIPTAKAISTVYDRIGAYFNAFTTKEFTAYVVNCEDQYLENCLSVLSDMLINSTFDKHQFLLERNVVIEETIRDEDDPESKIDDMSDRLTYTGSPFAKPVDDLSYHNASSLEYSGTIRSYQTFYIPSNMCLSVVSNTSFHTIREIVRSSFFVKGSLKQQIVHPEFPIGSFVVEENKGPLFDLQKRTGISATYLTITFRTCDYNHPDKYALCVLSEILGGYMSSRMFQILREENGLTYRSSCSTIYYKPMGELQLFTMTDPKKLMKHNGKKGVFGLLVDLLIILYEKGVTKEEVDIAKGHIKGTFIEDMQKAKNISFFNGSEYFIYECSQLVPYDQVFDTFYKTITKEDIMRVIRTYFIKERLAVCVLGEDIPSLSSIKKEIVRFTR